MVAVDSVVEDVEAETMEAAEVFVVAEGEEEVAVAAEGGATWRCAREIGCARMFFDCF